MKPVVFGAFEAKASTRQKHIGHFRVYEKLVSGPPIIVFYISS
jgi:hypothetical protein